MKTQAHYWYDNLGGWDFDYGSEVDIPKEVIEQYEKTKSEYELACDAVEEAIDKYRRLQ